MLKAQGLSLWRGATCLFDDLGFEAVSGEALLVRGANGSGKTTLLRVLAGLTLPETGAVRWGTEDLERVRHRELVLAYCGHLTALKPDLTVAENLRFFQQLQGSDPHRLQDVGRRLGLESLADLPLRFLSVGQVRRTALARVLASTAPLWLLDEPQTNLDGDGRRVVEEAVAEHLRRGGVAVIATHQDLLSGLRHRELQLGVVQ